MIRTLLFSAILMAVSSLVFADNIADRLDTKDAISSVVISAALAECTNTACEANLLVQAIEAGIDATSVMSMALAGDIDVDTIASALHAANVSESDIFAAAIANNQNPEDFTDATATGNTIIVNINRRSLTASGVPKGISPSGNDFAGPDNFDLPRFSVTPNNGVEFD